jgi:hypothetical protein
MTEVKEDGIILARHIPAAEAWKDGLQFFSQDSEFVQFGTWGYPKDKNLLAHIHNEVKREVLWTQEVIYVRKGKLRAHIFNSKEEKIRDIDVHEGDIIVLLRGGHGYTVLEEGTQVLEVKNGPYVGPDKDRRRIQK